MFPTAEHSRFTHGLGVMHEAGLWARSLYPSPAGRAAGPRAGRGGPVRGPGRRDAAGRGAAPRRRARAVRALLRRAVPRRASRRPPTRGARARKSLSHEDLSQLVIERELGPLIRGLRRAPGSVPERDRFADGEAIDPRWVSFLVSKPPLADASMPAWVRVLQPLLSGVFTVDNLDYVRRDAYLTGVSMGPVDAERLRRYTFVSERGLTLYESGVGALEMFLTARLFMHQHVYLHRTVRAIDLDLAEVFAPSILAVFGDGSPAERLGGVRGPRRVRAAAPGGAAGRAASACRPRPHPATGRSRAEIADGWRAILLRRPRWRAEHEVRVESATREWPAATLAELGDEEPGRVVLDLTGVDARPGADRPADARHRAARRRAGADARRGAVAVAGVAADRPPVPPRGLRGTKRPDRRRGVGRLVRRPDTKRQGPLTPRDRAPYSCPVNRIDAEARSARR